LGYYDEEFAGIERTKQVAAEVDWHRLPGNRFTAIKRDRDGDVARLYMDPRGVVTWERT
jgi:hypothetical protein